MKDVNNKDINSNKIPWCLGKFNGYLNKCNQPHKSINDNCKYIEKCYQKFINPSNCYGLHLGKRG